VEANGVGEVLSVRIAPELLAQRDLSTIEQLLPVAVNDALSRARQTQMSQMQSLGEGLNLPGLQEALARVQGGPS
jgi:DNA-binding protein YbaB